METPVSLHMAAQKLLRGKDAEGALRIVGPMLEKNPADLTAWRTAALATFEIGDKKTALKNLSSIVLALSEDRNPIWAIACSKEIESYGGDISSLITQLSLLYGKGSTRIEESDLAPPPLPKDVDVRPWGDEVICDHVLSMATDAMAMAWGASLILTKKEQKLPYIPLLSALEPEDFQDLVASLARLPVQEDEVIIKQGVTGDAMYIVAEGSVVVSHVSDAGERRDLAKLGPGAFFGEMALVSSTLRTAEVRAINNTVLHKANKADLEQLVQRAPGIGDVLIAFCHARMLENLIRVSPVLAPVPPAKRAELIARFGTDYRKTGDVIIKQGTEGPGLFLVVSGGVSVTREVDAENIHVASLKSGDLFGEISLLMRKPSTATVTASQNTALLVLSRDEFTKVTSEFPEILKGAYDIAVEREVKNNSILGQIYQDASDLILI